MGSNPAFQSYFTRYGRLLFLVLVIPSITDQHEIQQPVTSLIPSGHAITVPRVALPVEEHLPDWEVELVIVVGKAAKDVPEAKALDHVLGYTGANDVSFRKLQMGIPQW